MTTEPDFFSRFPSGAMELRLRDPADDRSLEVVAVNPAAQTLLGLSAGQLVGKLLDESFPRLHETGLLAVTADVARSGKMRELEDVLYLDNRMAAAMYRVRIYPLPETRAVSVFERIEGQDAPTATLASQLTAAEMVYAAADAIVSVDAQGTLRTFNPAAEEMTGLSAAEALGKNFAALGFTPASLELAQAELAQVFAGQVRPPVELELRNRAGRLLCVEANARRAVRAAEDVCAHVVLRDATRRKILEADLVAEQRLLKQLLAAHELERQLLAYEIHDGLVQHVTGALMHLETWASLEPPTRPAAVNELEISLKLLRETIAEARRLISGLRPPILDELGVVAAIQYLVDECRQESSMEIEFAARVDFDRLHPILESALFRIVQEALHNARRHSGSSRIRVALRQIGLRLRLEARDWGVGFDPQEVRETRFGLSGIRERARLLQGGATIDSQPGKGTHLCVDVPIWMGSPRVSAE